MEVAELGAASGLEDEGLIALKKEFFKKMTSMCHLHGKKIEYYCETCKELACETCFYSGYHSNPLHIGRPLESIVEERLGKVQHNINRVLRLKEMDLNESIRRLDKVFLHSKYIGNYIHNCTVNFYEALVHQVNSEFNKKIAKVSKVIGGVTEDATRINRIIYEANYLVVNKRHIDLFDNYDRLLKQAEYMFFKKHEDLILDETIFEEPVDRLQLIKQSKQVSTEMKKHIIFLNNLHYPLSNRRLEAQQLIQIEISPAILKHMADELSYLKDYLEQLKEFMRVCYYCGKIFSAETVNIGCYMNRTKVLPFNFVPFHKHQPPEWLPGTTMHFWGEPTYIDNILQFFVIINHEKKLINNEVIARTAQFFFVVMIAKMKKDLMIRRISIESILSRVKRSSAKYFEVLSFKYELSKATILEVIEIELLAEFLIKLTWTQEKALKDGRVTNLIRRDTAEDMMKSFEYFDFWFMRYKDVVQEGYKKAEDVVLDEDREESSAGGLGGGRKY